MTDAPTLAPMGWARPSLAIRRHVFVIATGKALCGRWYFPAPIEPLEGLALIRPQRDDCAVCRQKLNALLTRERRQA